MRFLLYMNLIAIVIVAGALARLYEGAPLPWVDRGSLAQTEGVATPAGEPVPSLPSQVVSQPDSPLSVEQVVALQLPLPNPDRVPAGDPASGISRPLRILTEGDYPPFNYRETNGALVGFDIELARAICEHLKASCSFETRPWGELLPALKRGEGDAVVASMLIPVPGRETPVTDEAVIFTDSYYSTPGRFAARKNAIPVSAAPGALTGKRIAAQAGSVHLAFSMVRFSNAELLTFPSLDLAQAALADGRADLLFGDRNTLLRWTSGPDGTCCRLVGPEYGDTAYFGTGAGIALRSEDKALRDNLNEALAALVADGTHARIGAHYFTGDIY